MTEHELHGMWFRARQQIIVSQLGPIFLLAVSVGLVMAGLGHQATPIRLAAALILLSSGILGGLVQISAAREAEAIAEDLAALGGSSAVSQQIVRSKKFTGVVVYVTPTIFVITYLALLWAIFAPQSLGGMY